MGHVFFFTGNFVKVFPLIIALCSSALANSAEQKIDFPQVENNVGFDQIQTLKFLSEDHLLAYGEDSFQFGKLYLPTNTKPSYPLIVFIHGGCWLNSFDMSHTYPFLTGLVQEGIAVWSLEYRRTGDIGGGWPGTYQDIKAGIDYVGSLDRYDIDTENFLIAGHSAGGHLALLAGTETPSARGVIAIAPITNIITYSQGTNTCQEATSQFMGSNYDDNELGYHQANPAEKAPHSNTVIFHGSLDEIVPIEQSRLPGATTKLEEGAGHFDWIHPGTNGFKRIVKTALGLMK